MKLNLGCGNEYLKGWVNVDIIDVKKDIKHDLNKIPYPFKKNTFNEILMKSVLEHLDNPILALKEVIRISKNQAVLTIVVPHAYSYASVTDIQHKAKFTENSFAPELLEEYDLKNLNLKKSEFLYKHKWKQHLPFKKFLRLFLNNIYDDMIFQFEVIKNNKCIGEEK